MTKEILHEKTDILMMSISELEKIISKMKQSEKEFGIIWNTEHFQKIVEQYKQDYFKLIKG